MTVLALCDVTLRVAGRTLLEGASLALEPGRKVGLVGRNGAGKSTLLRAILGEIEPEGGEIRLSARARVGHVAQEAPGGEASLLETVLAADRERTALLAELDSAPDPARIAALHDRLSAIGAESAPARAAAILSGLGFDSAAQKRPCSAFSGGWRMRVALARALFLEPDLLLLDEPTNHLDLEAALWLEGWLARFRGAALIVSHDRQLLNGCVDAIAHLDRGKITLYPGGYDSFLRIRAERAAAEAATAARLAAERARLQAFIDRFRAKATKARQAQSRLKALARLPVVVAPAEEAPIRFSFPDPGELPPPLLSLSRVSAGYDGRPVLREVSLRIDQDDRIALLGANGNGKSTLAKLLAGRLAPLAGELRRAPRLKVGYFAQHQAEELDLAATPLALMQAALPRATATACRAQLARFGLDAERAETRVADLSGGERARLLLALATREAPHLLILDEPTNHLDIEAREALIHALAEFRGAVVLIAHDPHLIGLIADRLLLVAEGTARPFDGDLEDYRALLAARATAAPARGGMAPGRAEERRARAEARAALAPIRARLAEIEARLARLHAEARLIEQKLADPARYARLTPKDLAFAGSRQAAIGREVAALEEEWLALSERAEAAA
jgi:ATP-binding cassette subfamily F protein 3